MKFPYIKKKFNAEQLAIIAICAKIIERYSDQGYVLTLRQLYYQCIAGELLPDTWIDPVTKSKNNEKSYKKLGNIISEARLAGLIDWDMIEDRGRVTHRPGHWDSPKELLRAAARAFARDKWRVQPNYIEVMVEKQALEGVLQPICEKLGVSFTSNKGYSSASAMFEAGRRLNHEFMNRAIRAKLLPERMRDERFPLKELIEDREQVNRLLDCDLSQDERPLFSLTEDAIADGWPRIGIIYFGDHDPSGIDMTRDVRDRLSMFSDAIPLEVHRVALNMDQIEELHPPENPAKETDSRAVNYIRKYGNSSWELDAVEPAELARMVEEKILEFRDDEIWDKSVKQEEGERAKAMKAIESIK